MRVGKADCFLRHAPIIEYEIHKNDELPAVFCALNEFDSIGTGKKTVQTAGLFVPFISELGKYYLLSRFDKKEVDLENSWTSSAYYKKLYRPGLITPKVITPAV